MRGPLTTVFSGAHVPQPWAGQAAIASGTATVTVSTNIVTSGALIGVFGVEVNSLDPAVISSGGFVAVNSIVDETSFALAWASGVAVPQDVVVSWLIMPTQ